MRRIIGIVGVVFLISSCITVSAQNTNDLLQFYGEEPLTGDLERYSDKTKMDRAVNDAKRGALLDEQYNSMVDAASEYNKEKINELASDITLLTNRNIDIQTEIQNNILGDREGLLELDRKHKSNVDRINSLLEKSKSYKVQGKKVVDYGSIEKLVDEASLVEQVYIDTVDVMELGTIDNIRVPVGNGSYTISSQFGDIVDPKSGNGFVYHTGVDINAEEGTSVGALFNGIVNTTGYGPIGGYYVSIAHGNGLISYYCHLSEIRVKVGDEVTQYQEIGLSGSSGDDVIVPHLHLGLYFNANAVDVGKLFEEE